MKYRHEIFKKLLKFRSNMNLSLSENDIKYIWGKKFLKEITKDSKLHINNKYENNEVNRKIQICKKHINKLRIFNWVQFIGISGSVAAGFAKEEDDIDVFVVVRDGTIWLYRGLVVLRNIFHNRIRAKRHKNVKDKLCLNFISEERGLNFENDIFNFHELMFLIPVYNEKYLNFIYSQNPWLEEEYYVKKENLQSKILPKKEINIIVRIFNYLAFVSQIIFMSIARHRPDIKNLSEDNKKGRIQFFEKDYKKDILKNYSKEFKSIN